MRRIDLRYRAYLRGHPCVVDGCGKRSCEPYPLKKDDDYFLLPLCGAHKEEAKREGGLEREYGINAFEVALEVLSEYLAKGS